MTLSPAHQNLVKFLAVKFWRKLPLSIRASVGAEDFYQLGYIFATRAVVQKYRKGRGSLSALLWTSLERYYISLCRSFLRSRRLTDDPILAHHIARRSEQPDMVRLLAAQQCFQKVFMAAGEESQDLLWRCLTGQGNLSKTSISFHRSRYELRELANEFGLTYDDCLILLRESPTAQSLLRRNE